MKNKDTIFNKKESIFENMDKAWMVPIIPEIINNENASKI